ncbi:hypothetical protein [Methanolobus tindarius]|uniref:hypothetical protein n=1 Tax=Methanolobus tindarius TaxID=2221 RepID=UPI0012ECA8A5|nr:hypothetical protein [Methanolobus tindarius]
MQTTSAVSVGASPYSLEFDLKEGIFQKNITIINNGNEFSTYSVYTADEYSDLVGIFPSSFDLSPSMTKEVTVICIPPELASGNISLKISIAACSDNSKLGMGAGIRIPVTIIQGEIVDNSGTNVYTSFSRHIMNFF